MITESQRRALEILKEYGPLTAKYFSQRMWPDSPGWQRSINCGPNGAHRGGGMYRAGGGYLGRLCKRGLVRQIHRNFHLPEYVLTADGKVALTNTPAAG